MRQLKLKIKNKKNKKNKKIKNKKEKRGRCFMGFLQNKGISLSGF